MSTVTQERPETWQEILRHTGQGEIRQRSITHGWYVRGSNVNGEWQPEPGLPSDVLVYLDMGDPYVREMYPDKGYLALSDVPTKKAIANLDPLFNVLPPKLDDLRMVMQKLLARRGEARAVIQDEIDVHEQKLVDGGLPIGEPAQYRRKIAALGQRLQRFDDDREYDAYRLYEAMVRERQAVLESQMDPDAVRLAALEKEHRAWDDQLARVAEERASATPDSTTTRTARRGSTPLE